MKDNINHLKNILEKGRPIKPSLLISDFNPDRTEYDFNSYSLLIYKVGYSSYQLRGITKDVDIFLDWFISEMKIDIDQLLSIEGNFILGEADEYNSFPYVMELDVGYPSIYDGFKASFFISEVALDKVLEILCREQ